MMMIKVINDSPRRNPRSGCGSNFWSTKLTMTLTVLILQGHGGKGTVADSYSKENYANDESDDGGGDDDHDH